MAYSYGPDVWDRIAPPQARLLGLRADDLTEGEAAGVVGLTLEAVKSAVERLKQLFDCKTVRELRRIWRAVRGEYVEYVRKVAGL
ncbi:MAG: hypothetical protein ACRDHF_01195 [Tepidiformaceae bacterium]